MKVKGKIEKGIPRYSEMVKRKGLAEGEWMCSKCEEAHLGTLGLTEDLHYMCPECRQPAIVLGMGEADSDWTD